MMLDKPLGARRYKRVGISAEMFRHLVTTGWDSHNAKRQGIVCLEGVPPDARLVQAYAEQDYYPMVVWLVFEHPSWPVAEPGRHVPILHPLYQAYVRNTDDGGRLVDA